MRRPLRGHAELDVAFGQVEGAAVWEGDGGGADRGRGCSGSSGCRGGHDGARAAPEQADLAHQGLLGGLHRGLWIGEVLMWLCMVPEAAFFDGWGMGASSIDDLALARLDGERKGSV